MVKGYAVRKFNLVGRALRVSRVTRFSGTLRQWATGKGVDLLCDARAKKQSTVASVNFNVNFKRSYHGRSFHSAAENFLTPPRKLCVVGILGAALLFDINLFVSKLRK
jgi:hypothetical protein